MMGNVQLQADLIFLANHVTFLTASITRLDMFGPPLCDSITLMEQDEAQLEWISQLRREI